MKKTKIVSAFCLSISIVLAVVHGKSHHGLLPSLIVLLSLTGLLLAVQSWKQNKKDKLALSLVIGNSIIGFSYLLYLALLLLILLGLHIRLR